MQLFKYSICPLPRHYLKTVSRVKMSLKTGRDTSASLTWHSSALLYLTSFAASQTRTGFYKTIETWQKKPTHSSMFCCRSGAGRAVFLIMFEVCSSVNCFLGEGITVHTSIGR